jgi:hypothetical protein
MTYLGFGILAGASSVLAYLRYAGGGVNATDTLQIWISVITAFTGGLSAYAAYNAATITKIAHHQLQETGNVRISSAKQLILAIISTIEKAWENRDAGIRLKSTQFLTADHVIGEALKCPLNELQYIALWTARSTFREVQAALEISDTLTPEQIDELLSRLKESASRMEG